MAEKIMVIGITGYAGSGKDTIADYLESKGYDRITGSDIIKEKMRSAGLTAEDRSSIYEFVKGERERYGNSYPSGEVIQRIKRNTVVAGFRNLEEVGLFKETFGSGFFLISVYIPIAIRYQRIKGRNRQGDDVSFEKFEVEEKQEIAGSTSHEIKKVIYSADFQVENSGSKEDLFKKIEKILLEIHE